MNSERIWKWVRIQWRDKSDCWQPRVSTVHRLESFSVTRVGELWSWLPGSRVSATWLLSLIWSWWTLLLGMYHVSTLHIIIPRTQHPIYLSWHRHHNTGEGSHRVRNLIKSLTETILWDLDHHIQLIPSPSSSRHSKKHLLRLKFL